METVIRLVWVVIVGLTITAAVGGLASGSYDRINTWAKRLTITLVVAGTLLLVAIHAIGATKSEVSDRDLVLLLARTCVAEIGFVGTSEECELMWSVNQRNAIARRRTLKNQTQKFNAYWGRGRQSQMQRRSRPWIQYLGGIKRPKQWPKTITWRKYVGEWARILKKSESFVNSNRQKFHDCDDAIDYGAPGETPRMKNVRQLKCLGGTRQRYWAFGWTKKRGDKNGNPGRTAEKKRGYFERYRYDRVRGVHVRREGS